MELRTLRYFVEVATRGSFTAAACSLGLTQPTLSKQIMEFEEELGRKLFVRGKRRVTLTEAGEGMLESAREILELADRAKRNIGSDDSGMTGELYIAGGETRVMRIVARAIKKVRERHPGVKFHLFSGNAEAVSERLDKGLADFGAFVRPANLAKFDYITLPEKDVWGVLVRRDHHLASLAEIRPSDLAGAQLICSSQHMTLNEIAGWAAEIETPLNIIGTYALLYNAAIMAREGAGVVLCLDGIADTSLASDLCFRPFRPALEVNMAIAWKKGARFSPAASAFLREMREIIQESQQG